MERIDVFRHAPADESRLRRLYCTNTVAVFRGVFDPVHQDHLAPRTVSFLKFCDELWFVPSPDRWDKRFSLPRKTGWKCAHRHRNCSAYPHLRFELRRRIPRFLRFPVRKGKIPGIRFRLPRRRGQLREHSALARPEAFLRHGIQTGNSSPNSNSSFSTAMAFHSAEEHLAKRFRSDSHGRRTGKASAASIPARKSAAELAFGAPVLRGFLRSLPLYPLRINFTANDFFMSEAPHTLFLKASFIRSTRASPSRQRLVPASRHHSRAEWKIASPAGW